MKNFPELIHIAAHFPKVVLRVAEGSTDREEEEEEEEEECNNMLDIKS